MAELRLRVATGGYHHVRALLDGTVRPAGISLDYETMFVGDIFRKAIRDGAFDACELGLTLYLGTLDRTDPPFIAIPVFPIRAFRHSAIFVSADSGIRAPADLAGKRLGELFFYGHDAGIWARGALADDYGVTAAPGTTYTVGGIDHYAPPFVGLPFDPYPPAGVSIRQLGAGQTLGAMLEAGELDAVYSAIMPPALLERGRIRRLFEDFESVERDYFARTGIFPIMHTFVIRKEIYDRDPWVARALYDAFVEAKAVAQRERRAADTFMYNSFLEPWFYALREKNRRLMGEDPWAYGLEANRTTLEAFIRHHHDQGLSRHRRRAEELFAAETLD